MHSEWTDRFSDYIDDELGPDERRAVEAHTASCPECARVLDDLRGQVERAGMLSPTLPDRDLWEGIAATIAAPPTPAAARRYVFTMPQLIAASLVLATLSGWGALRLAQPAASLLQSTAANEDSRPSVAPPSMVVNASAIGSPADAVVTPALDDAAYDRAVADLEAALTRDRALLDPATIAVVEDNLAIIDQAVQEARQALLEDPANTYLSVHFTQTRQRKLDLLRQAAALAVDTN